MERKYTTIRDTSKKHTQIDRNNTQVEKGDQTECDKETTKGSKSATRIYTETAQNTSKDNKNKQFIASNLASLPLVDPSTTETQVTTKKRTQIKIVQRDQTTTKNTESYSENFIIIIDNIPKNILPKSLEDIKNRIKPTSTKHIKTDFVYTLPRGGIAIHLHSEEDIENLEKNIGKIYPGSSCTMPLAKQDKSRIAIKNVNSKIYTEAITNYVLNSANNIRVRRFFSSANLHPRLIICITCDKELAIKYIQEGIDLFGKTQRCETYKKTTIRCYNCQKFNHIAKHCIGQQCCHNCGKQHQKTQTCKNLLYCVNCKQQGHQSSSRNCPTYK